MIDEREIEARLRRAFDAVANADPIAPVPFAETRVSKRRRGRRAGLVLAGAAAAGLVIGVVWSASRPAGPRVEVSTDTTTTTTPLTGAQRAQRVIDIQRALGVDMHYSFSALAASLASGKASESTSCANADDDQFHRGEIASAAQANHETPDHWTRVEAGYIAGACPAQLSTFFASLSRIGYPQVASQVAAELQRLHAVP